MSPAPARSTTGPADLVGAARQVQALPYCWPGPPDADATRALGAGTCAGKHALLAEIVECELGLACGHLLVVGPLVPALWPDIVGRGARIVEVHECLTGYAVARSGLRDQKLALRDRLCTPLQRSIREELLALIADLAARL